MTPWLGRPTSYASGYISAHRTSVASHSLTVEFSSPPTYWMGFWTCGRSASRRGKTDSTGISATFISGLGESPGASAPGRHDPQGYPSVGGVIPVTRAAGRWWSHGLVGVPPGG